MTALSDASPEIAIVEHLKTLYTAYQIAWPNVRFTPAIGTPFYRTAFLAVPSERLTHGKADRHTGIFQVDAAVPARAGAPVAINMARAIASHFDRKKITGSGATAEIIRPPSLGPHRQDVDWYIVPVSVTYTILN